MSRDFVARLPLHNRAFFAFVRLLDTLGLGQRFLSFMLRRVLPVAFERLMMRSFDGYTPTERDVFVAVYPKAGNNWLMQIAAQIVFKGKIPYEHIHDVVAWPQSPISAFVVPLSAPVHEQSPAGMRVIKTQIKHPGTPYSPRAQYLTVLRDPGDVMVSMHTFVNALLAGVVRVQFTLDELHAYVVADRFPICWAEHAASWWALRDKPNVSVFLFRDMKADLDGVVRQIAAQLGVSLTEAEHAAVVEHSSFGWMKAREDLFAPPFPSFRGEGAVLINKGQVGGSKAMLSPAQREALDAHYRRKLAALGSDLPYDDLFGATAGR